MLRGILRLSRRFSLTETVNSNTPPKRAPQVSSLIGSRDLNTSLICLASLKRFAKAQFNLVILDDGSLSNDDVMKINDVLESPRIIPKNERDNIINKALKGYPSCLAFRNENILAQKLIDLFIFTEDDLIQYIDSDVLFLARFSGFPLMNSTEEPIFMADLQSAYSISPIQLIRDQNLSLPRALNSGMIVFPKHKFDLSLIEDFLSRYGKTRSFVKGACWAEQTCWALLASQLSCRLWNPEQIIIANPVSLKTVSSDVVGIHFVRSYRNLLERTLNQAQLDDDGERLINSISAKILTSFEFILERLGKKFARAPFSYRT